VIELHKEFLKDEDALKLNNRLEIIVEENLDRLNNLYQKAIEKK
jgi:hypothetical protein